METAFSAEYLYQGAKLLFVNTYFSGQNGKVETLRSVARAVYSLGIAVIAPLGMLYHTAACCIHYGKTWLPGRNVVALQELITHHGEAIGHDFHAFFGMISVLLLTTAVALSVVWGSYVGLGICLTSFVLVMTRESAPMLVMPYGSGKNGWHFMSFLSQRDRPRYLANFIYREFVKAGIALDQPLTDELIKAFDIRRIDLKEGPLMSVMACYSALADHGRLTETYRGRVQQLLSDKNKISRLSETIEHSPEQEERAAAALKWEAYFTDWACSHP